MQITPKPLCWTFHIWVPSTFTMKYKGSSGITGELYHRLCNRILLKKPMGGYSLDTQCEQKLKLLMGSAMRSEVISS